LNQLVQGTNYESAPLDKIILNSAYDAKQVGIFNNAAQHFNHSFYWKCLKPNSNSNLEGCETLVNEIKKTFGSMDDFKEEVRKSKVLI
jgi:superoxide dismutase, Fe-Mn family